MNTLEEANFHSATVEIIERLGFSLANSILNEISIKKACKNKGDKITFYKILIEYGFTGTQYQKIAQKIRQDEDKDAETNIEEPPFRESNQSLLRIITKKIKSDFPKKSRRRSLVNLLVIKNLSPEEASIKAGYDPYEVFDFFKKEYGMTPGNYQTGIIERGEKKVKIKPRIDRSPRPRRGLSVRVHIKHPDDY